MSAMGTETVSLESLISIFIDGYTIQCILGFIFVLKLRSN